MNFQNSQPLQRPFMWWTIDALFTCFELITCKAFLSARRAHLVSRLPNKQLKLSLWQMTTINDDNTLLVLFQTRKEFMSAKLKNDVNNNVICSEKLLVKVSNWRFYHSLAHTGISKNLVCSRTALQSITWTKESNGCGFDLDRNISDQISFGGKAKFHLQEISGVFGVTATSFLYIWLKLIKVVSATFLVVWFLGLNESNCQMKKNIFHFTSKPLSVLKKIKF